MITARNFSSCPSDSISRWTPCPPEIASGGFRSALAVSDFRLRARLDFSLPSTSPASEALNPAFGYNAPHPSAGGTSTLLINALLSAHHHPMGGSRPMAFLGCARGHRIDSETRCCRSAHGTPNECMDTLPRTRASPEPMGHHRGVKPGRPPEFCGNAQAACVFSCSASKRSSFFQSVTAMAAIFRANVSRAISGFMPFSSKAR